MISPTDKSFAEFQTLLSEFNQFSSYNSRSYLQWLDGLSFKQLGCLKRYFVHPEYNPANYSALASCYFQLLQKSSTKSDFVETQLWQTQKNKIHINALEDFIMKSYLPGDHAYNKLSSHFYYDDEALSNLVEDSKNYCPSIDKKICEELKKLKQKQQIEEITESDIEDTLKWDIRQRVLDIEKLSAFHFSNTHAYLEISEDNLEAIFKFLSYSLQQKELKLVGKPLSLCVEFFNTSLMLRPVKEASTTKVKWACSEELINALNLFRNSVEGEDVEQSKLENKLQDLLYKDLSEHLKSNQKNDSDFFLQTSMELLKRFDKSHTKRLSHIRLKISGATSLAQIKYTDYERSFRSEIDSLAHIHKTKEICKLLRDSGLPCEDASHIERELKELGSKYETASQIYPEELTKVWLIDQQHSSYNIACLLKSLIDKKVIKVLSWDHFIFEHEGNELAVFFGKSDQRHLMNSKTIYKEHKIIPLATTNSLHLEIKDHWYKAKECHQKMDNLSEDEELEITFFANDSNLLIRTIRNIHLPEISSNKSEAVGIYIPEYFSIKYIKAAVQYLESKGELKTIDQKRGIYEHLGKTVALQQTLIPATIQYRHIGDQEEIYGCLDAEGKFDDGRLAIGLATMKEKYKITE